MTDTRRTHLLATLALVGITAAWGSTFFMTKDLLERLPLLDYLAVRFTIAGLFLALLAPRSLRSLSGSSAKHAVLLGAMYGVAQVLQTAGLILTPASVAGFITGMYVVLTPVLGALLLRHRVGGWTWFAVALAMTGLAVLTLDGLSVGYGEALVLVSTVLYAGHIVGLGVWSKPDMAIGMSIVQLLVIAVIAWVVAVPDGIQLPGSAADWARLLYMSIVAGALAMLGQTWAQAHLPAVRTAIIMAMEPVFAAFFAVLFGGEDATVRMLAGGLLVLAAMVLVETLPRRRVEAEVTHLSV